MTRTYRLDTRPEQNEQPARWRKRASKSRPSPLTTLHARVRSLSLTPEGDLACVLDTPAGRLRVYSDAAAVHLPQLAVGRDLQVALLRQRRVTEDAVWHWQLLGCRSAAEQGAHATPELSKSEGSPA